jgi:COX assembly protein 1
MNSCLLSYQGQDELDKARMQWFQEAGERKRAREEREIKAAEALKKHREYWGIEDTEARLKKEREEKERRRVERAREEREEQLRREMDARKKGWGR